MAKSPGAELLGEVHPVGAQNKTLISDTAIPASQSERWAVG